MKKGIIVSIEGNNLIVLTNNGKFVKHKNKNNQIGESITLGLSNTMRYALASALMMTFIMCGGITFASVSAYNRPVSFVSIDINPSVEFTLNSIGKVLSVVGANDDGKILIANEKFENLTIEQATSRIVDLAAKAGYFYLPNLPNNTNENNFIPEQNFNAMMVTVIDDNNDTIEKIINKATDSVEKYFIEKQIFCLILSRDGNYNNKDDAMQEGMSLGKLELVNKLQHEVDFEIAKTMSVGELTKKIYDKHKKEYNSYDFNQFADKKELYIQKNQPRLDKYSFELKNNNELKKQFNHNFESMKQGMIEKICIGWDGFKDNWQPPYKLVA